MGKWQSLAVCPRCEGTLAGSAPAVCCDFCGSRYDVIDEIPRLVIDKGLDSTLDPETYAKLSEVGPNTLSNYHKEFAHALDAVGLGLQGCMLELGMGTGNLTESMLLHAQFETIISTDVSLAFARHTRQRLERFSETVEFVVCDGNRLPFRSTSFDLVLGRSVLHRLLHYRATLSGVLRLLKPGGAAVFFEPVQAGKAYVAFMFRIILGIDASTGSIGLNDGEKMRMMNRVKGMTRSISISQDVETLSKLEDKYNFDTEDLCREALDIGFAVARYVPMPNVDPTYFPHLSMNLRNAGVRPEVIDKVRWLRSAFGDTIGAVAGHRLTAPMGYFVFVKADSAARARRRHTVVENAVDSV